MTGFYTQPIPDLETFSGPVQPEAGPLDRARAISLNAIDTFTPYARTLYQNFTDTGAAEHLSSPLLSPDEANQKYGIGDLKFSHPVREDDAEYMHQSKANEMQRADVLARTPDGFASGAGNFLMGAALDPLNSAAMMLPELGGARIARLAFGGKELGELGLAARTGARAIQGGVNNALVQGAVFSPLRLGASAISGTDYTPADALTDIAQGALFGGALDAGFGGVHDIWTKGFRGSLEGRLADTNPETSDLALRSALAQLNEGRPVDVNAIFANDARVRMDAGGIAPEVLTGEYGQPMRFSTEEEAQAHADALTESGLDLAPQPHPEGGFVLSHDFNDGMADLLRDNGAGKSALEYAAGKNDAVTQEAIDRAQAASGKLVTPADHADLAQKIGDQYEHALKQAHAEGRLSDAELNEVSQISDNIREIESKLEKYASLAACMTQEV